MHNPQVLNGRGRIQFVNDIKTYNPYLCRVYTYRAVVNLHAKLNRGLNIGRQETAQTIGILSAYQAHSGICPSQLN